MVRLLLQDYLILPVIKQIKKHFGSFESKEVPTFEVAKEAPIASSVSKSVTGPDAEFMYMAYRFEGVDSRESQMIQICDMILANSTAGIIDLNLNLKHNPRIPYSYKTYNMSKIRPDQTPDKLINQGEVSEMPDVS